MTTHALDWALSHYARRGGSLLAGGYTLSALADRHGTPMYVYDLGVVRATVAALRAALGPRIALHYAVKANPHPAILGEMIAAGLGFDVASAGELLGVLQAGGDPGHIGFAGPGKRLPDLRAALQAGIGFLSVESQGELERAASLARSLGLRGDVGLRLNPPAALSRAGQRMGGGSRAFGIDSEAAGAVLESLGASSVLRFRGFHLYPGAQVLDAETLLAQLHQSFEVVLGLLPQAPVSPEIVDLGGGFGVPYTASDRPLDLAAVGRGLSGLLDEYVPRLPRTRFVIELGRALVAAAGIYVTRVIDRKVSRGQTHLILDGGLHHFLAATGNFGQVIHRPFPVCAPEHLDVPPEAYETVSLAGPLCTPLDTFGARVALPPLAEGELVAVMCAGAYGLTASPQAFLSHPPPAECVLP